MISQDVFQNSNGTFSHRLNRAVEWASFADAKTDFRFHEEWTR